MNWKIRYLPEAEKDLQNLDGSSRLLTIKAISKVQENPLPQNEGGRGKPLGHKSGSNLTGFLKIKLKRIGIRVVYKLVRADNIVLIVVIGIRSDDEAYELAAQRKANCGFYQ